MNELVFLHNEQALTTSLKVADKFKKEHKNVVRDIRTLIEQMASESQSSNLASAMFQETQYQAEAGGRYYPMFLMNYDGFTLLTMGFSGKKALKFKLDYIQAFNAMKQKIIELMAERKSEEWRAIRRAGKQGNKDMCAVIDQYLLPLAREQGYTRPDKLLYVNYQNAVNRAAGIKPGSRDELPIGQLYEIEKLQSIVGVSIKGRVARGDHFKQIYRDTDQTLRNYAQLSLIPERFLPA